MSDHDDDPYASEIAGDKKKRAADPDALAPGAPDEGDGVDRAMSFQALNDFGNAVRLKTRFGEDLLFVENVGWFVWDRKRWLRSDGEALKLAHRTAQAIRDEAAALKEKPGAHGEARAVRLYRHAEQSGNAGSASAMLRTAAPYLTRPLAELDREPHLVTCPSGTIVLGAHCELRAHDRSDLITRTLATAYNPRAQCPRWLAFLEDIMPAPDMRDFLQRILGYCLTGSTREQAFFIFWGGGNNGKSTLMNVVRHIMAEYTMNSPVSTFLAKREGTSGSDASPDLARLPGARLVTAAEPPEGARLDEGKIKEMASGEPMTVRHLNQGFFEFCPVFKAIISTNHRPVIRGTDRGIWRRIRLVPFTVEIPEERIDRNLETKLLDEAEGILMWMLTGVEEWSVRGLAPPDAAIAAVEDYRADEDPVGEFLKAKCHVSKDYLDPSTGKPFETSAKRLREIYKAWCEEEGLDPLNTRIFGSKLTGRGIERRKTGGNTVYVGLAIESDLAFREAMNAARGV